MNSITIAGTLGRDAEQRFLPNGDAVSSFSVADSQGRDKPTTWWSCSMFGKRSEALHKYLVKGQSVTVVGSVTEREFTDKNGQQRKVMDVRVNDVALQGGKPQGQASEPHQDQRPQQQRPPQRTDQRPTQAPRQAPARSNSGDFSDMEDDIPFNDPMKSRAFAMSI